MDFRKSAMLVLHFKRCRISIASSLSDLEDPERFNAYRQCAEELLNTLATYVPMLLANEQFFKNMKE